MQSTELTTEPPHPTVLSVGLAQPADRLSVSSNPYFPQYKTSNLASWMTCPMGGGTISSAFLLKKEIWGCSTLVQKGLAVDECFTLPCALHVRVYGDRIMSQRLQLCKSKSSASQ